MSETEAMEPQHFRLKRWIRTVQTVSGIMVIGLGVSNLLGPGNPIVGVFFVAFGMYALGQVVFAGVVATEEGLSVRYNIPKAKFHAWEDIEYAPASRVLMLRLKDGQMTRIPPYLEEMEELRWMIDDTVGSPPPAETLRRKKN
jgi:hypothetical protein